MAEAGARDSAMGVKILHIGWRGRSSLSLGPDRAGPYHDQARPPDREDLAFPQHARAEFRRMKIFQGMRELARRRNQDSEGFVAATPPLPPPPPFVLSVSKDRLCRATVVPLRWPPARQAQHERK